MYIARDSRQHCNIVPATVATVIVTVTVTGSVMTGHTYLKEGTVVTNLLDETLGGKFVLAVGAVHLELFSLGGR